VIKFSFEVSKCVEEWARVATNCKGETKCLELASRQLRRCLDITFPPSSNVELEADKINYILSSVFLLSNRLAKAIVALAELDEAISINLKESNKNEHLKNILNEVISRYF
jgi:hypothetical protein